MLIEPLPTCAISLEKRLRRDTECFACEDTPENWILPIAIQQFLDENNGDEYMIVQSKCRLITANGDKTRSYGRAG